MFIVKKISLSAIIIILKYFFREIDLYFLIVEHPGPSQRLKKTIDIDTHKVLLKESGVNLTLTIVDTPGTYIKLEF